MPFDKEPVIPVEKEKDEETQSDFDMDSAVAEVSSDLFGQGGDEEGNDKAPVEGEELKPSGDTEVADVVEAPPQPEKAVEENAAEVQAVGAPTTWTKEALETWATIPPRAQQEIMKREEDFFKGIEQYKGAAELGQKYDTVVEPYRALLTAENIDPVQMFQSFSANHYILMRGTPEQKIELAAAMLDGYQIPLPELLNHLAERDYTPPDANTIRLENELKELRTIVNGGVTAQRNQQNDAISREIEAFAADPTHPHFNELADDISKIFGAGLATTLQEAYDKAVYANPATRQKEIDRLTAEKLSTAATEEQKRKDKRVKSTAEHVDASSKPRDGTVPIGSMDDTLEETYAAIKARG